MKLLTIYPQTSLNKTSTPCPNIVNQLRTPRSHVVETMSNGSATLLPCRTSASAASTANEIIYVLWCPVFFLICNLRLHPCFRPLNLPFFLRAFFSLSSFLVLFPLILFFCVHFFSDLLCSCFSCFIYRKQSPDPARLADLFNIFFLFFFVYGCTPLKLFQAVPVQQRLPSAASTPRREHWKVACITAGHTWRVLLYG